MKKTLRLALLFTSPVFAAPPVHNSVAPVLGLKAFHDGDVIEILDVATTSPRLEPGDTLTVKGRVR